MGLTVGNIAAYSDCSLPSTRHKCRTEYRLKPENGRERPCVVPRIKMEQGLIRSGRCFCADQSGMRRGTRAGALAGPTPPTAIYGWPLSWSIPTCVVYHIVLKLVSLYS